MNGFNGFLGLFALQVTCRADGQKGNQEEETEPKKQSSADPLEDADFAAGSHPCSPQAGGPQF